MYNANFICIVLNNINDSSCFVAFLSFASWPLTEKVVFNIRDNVFISDPKQLKLYQWAPGRRSER